MSQQLTISSLISVLALVTLALFARAGDIASMPSQNTSLVQVETTEDSTV